MRLFLVNFAAISAMALLQTDCQAGDDALKDKIPPRGMMGDNLAALDAAKEVLKNKFDFNEVYTRWGEDDNPDDFDEAVFQAAIDSSDWLFNETGYEPFSSGW